MTGFRLTVNVLLVSRVAGGNGGIRLGPFAITVEIMTPADVSVWLAGVGGVGGAYASR